MKKAVMATILGSVLGMSTTANAAVDAGFNLDFSTSVTSTCGIDAGTASDGFVHFTDMSDNMSDLTTSGYAPAEITVKTNGGGTTANLFITNLSQTGTLNGAGATAEVRLAQGASAPGTVSGFTTVNVNSDTSGGDEYALTDVDAGQKVYALIAVTDKETTELASGDATAAAQIVVECI
ncbi:hypothetical protein L4D09_13185 [Photobacterium makurazakiensis]|uniref:hypothetical protein n=1 Tax=Photobacterium makurazakiensis TaxID=2910234 RepID=UPI003D0CFC16